ncbi:hypothetical protein HYR99_03390 [Candidatus Poribacteria bacterium]|nr:hypothetical protein [Candidatus Poribacteria bacterium]
MSDDLEHDPKFQAFLESAAKLRPYLETFGKAASFELPEPTKKKFLSVHSLITTTPQLATLSRLTIEGGSRKDWLKRFTSAVLDDVQEGLAASYYHLANIEHIEQEVISAALSTLAHLEQKIGTTVGGGNTRKLNFEYQAFAFSIRRTMEYLAASVNAFFKRDGNRIRDLVASIKGAEPTELREKVRTKAEKLLQGLQDLLPPSRDDLSVRDQLAHWKTVPAGHLNVTWTPTGILVGFAGGGQNINPWEAESGLELKYEEMGGIGFMQLTPVLQDQIMRVDNLIFSLYSEMGLYNPDGV